jgi:hypothetical protein
MKKILLFYIQCCIYTRCLDIIMICLSLNQCDIGSPDFKFGFSLMVLANCAIYAPIYTLTASILYYTNVNKALLSSKWLCFLYCNVPFVCYELIEKFCIYNGFNVDYRLEYSIPIVFIIQNVIIILNHVCSK